VLEIALVRMPTPLPEEEAVPVAAVATVAVPDVEPVHEAGGSIKH